MQDRFKFRTYIPDRKFFKFWGWISKGEYKGLCPSGEDGLDVLLEKYTNQCTGLKDIKEILIYEGDICKDKFGKLFTVYFDNKYACFFLRDKNNEIMAIYPDILLEIIGNIYEDKELLEANNANNIR